MYLVYIDESGNTGLNLKDTEQPVFIMAAIIVDQLKWFSLEKEFLEIAVRYFGRPLPDPFHVQAKELKSGRGLFSKLCFEEQLSFRDEMLNLLYANNIPVIYRRIIKFKFSEFCEFHYGPGIKVNPYIMALPFVCMEVDHYIKSQGSDKLGMLIFDEQKENYDAAERSLKTLRLDRASILKTERIIEKGFFVDSQKSFALQLVDIAAYYIRKYEEYKLGFRVSKYDAQTFEIVEKLTTTGTGSRTSDVLEWVKNNWAK
ncbi:MAG: DUF3800 domain-containing protein [Sedimentisphaerales bacterium]|nr:DUF3800 domain-containing protein [Sedimentisphaerales bacterium]